VDLRQRRLLAAAQERLAQALFDETTPAPDIVALLEEEALRVQAALRNTTAGRLQWASVLLPQVLADAESRRLQREATGSAVLGVPTGLAQLDNILGGLTEGRARSHFSGQLSSSARGEVAIRFNMFHRPAL
jgi:replicative DNA helicase